MVYFHVASGNLLMRSLEHPGHFTNITVKSNDVRVKGDNETPHSPPARLRGQVKWFSKSKGFGFIVHSIGEVELGPDKDITENDVFFHRSDVLPDNKAADSVPLLSGTPVMFSVVVQDDKIC